MALMHNIRAFLFKIVSKSTYSIHKLVETKENKKILKKLEKTA